MRQRIYYNSDDYSGSIIIWIIIIACFCLFFWWIPGTGNYTTDTYNNVAANSYNSYNGGWWWWWVIIGILVFWWICTLCYAPLSVDADDDEVRIRRPFKTRRIKMSEIESVQPYQVSKKPGKKAFRTSPIRAFGHWGHYHDDNIGDYFAYYGKPDHTVLITLKDGRKYVVGGTDSKAMSDYINSKLKKD